ncbi:DUF2637 domain-containing protein [Micromonospora sp. DT227]|uniref:DUF2637 domain-containing protein n=1 Tax=Micromonospora sp. DT227 TaxID=3393433 RepID=UPI003CF238C2
MTSTAPQASPVPPATPHDTRRLGALRWAVRATLTLGVAASVAANILHARPNPISQIIAAWPPLALLLTVELISRVPHHRWQLGAIRVTAATCIAAIAAWVSYWHLVGVASRYGENSYGAAYLLPLSVDGLVIVASVSLVEISARIRAATIARDAASVPAPTSPIIEPLTEGDRPPSGASPQRLPLAAEPDIAANADDAIEAVPSAAEPRKPLSFDQTADDEPTAPSPGAEGIDDERVPFTVLTHGDEATWRAKPEIATSRGPKQADAPRAAGAAARRGAPTADTTTASAVAYWQHHDPKLLPAEVAARIGRSERTVRRHWQPRTGSQSARAHGHPTSKRRR